MRLPTPQDDWPESWRLSHAYDCNEVLPPPDRYLGYRYAYDLRQQSVLGQIAALTPPGARVLDLAAAQGNTTLALARMGCRVVWNDIRAELAGYVRLKREGGSKRESGDEGGDIAYRPGNILEMPARPEFDAVVAMEVIEHVAHPDVFMAHIAGFLKPGGILVLTTPNGAYFRYDMPKFSECEDPSQYEGIQFGPNGADHIFLLHAGELAALAGQAGLEVLSLEYTANPLTHGHIKLWKLLPWLPARAVRRLDRWTRRLPGKAWLHDNMTLVLRAKS